jgi:hypothetical protein
MSRHIGVFRKTGDEELIERFPVNDIDSNFVKRARSLEDDESAYGGCYDVTPENLEQVQPHVAEPFDLNTYFYQLCDERDD